MEQTLANADPKVLGGHFVRVAGARNVPQDADERLQQDQVGRLHVFEQLSDDCHAVAAPLAQLHRRQTSRARISGRAPANLRLLIA